MKTKKKDRSKNKKPTGLELAVSLCKEADNDWGGGDDAETIAKAALAVVVSRDQDSWVLAAEDWQHVAGIELGCLHTEYETEWVDSVYDVATGEQLTYQATTIVEVEAPDGRIYVQSSRPKEGE